MRESHSQAIVQKWGFCMKLKYYLRGLGIGIVVTALLMGVSSSKEAKAETTQVAAVEKMTEGETGTSETTVEESNAAETITTQEAKTTETETQEEIRNTEDTEQVEEEVSTIIMEEETMASVEIADGAAESYLLNIVKGDDSGTVARKLQNAGLVENATEFDAFLMQHGYDKKISVGVVEIPLNATWMEIAQKLSGSAE